LGFLKRFLTADIPVQQDTPLYRRLILANGMLFISVLTLFFFAVYNIVVNHNFALGIADAVACGLSLFAMIHMRRTKKLLVGALIGSANLFVFLIFLTYIHEAKDFTIIWTIFMPLFAILVLGRYIGLFVSVAFYAIVFTIAYNGIDIWQEGAWNTVSYIRYVISSLVLIFIMYTFEESYEKAYEKLDEAKQKAHEQMKQMEQLAITDPLTRLYNRRHLNTLFRRMFSVARVHNHKFGLFVMDLDHFKLYNDYYGHQMGDYVLQEVAKVMRDTLRREADAVFRLGGEEFSGLVMAESEADLLEQVEHIRQGIESLQITHQGNQPFDVVTVSIGVCIIDRFDEENFDAMYKLADDALYQAKDEGRNRTCGGIKELAALPAYATT
jgi:diguanylate cyclase (GGDEF)-like protein